MNIRGKILEIANANKKFTVTDVLRYLDDKVSRQYISRLINELVAEKKLIKAGSTRKAAYSLPKNVLALGNKIKKRIKNKNLQEHKILEIITAGAPFILKLKDNVRSIFDYAFSEMLNNAIEHSGSKEIEVEAEKRGHLLTFQIRDFGVGVFRNVIKKRNLKSEFEAMQDLLKGKTTTAPKAHTGEGIFFTSKIADVFILDSFGFRMKVDNQLPDVFFEKTKYLAKGTKVTFSVALTSRKHLNDIFKHFQSNSENYAFDKTEIQIKLFTIGTVHISRSQARRVLAGLEKFKTVILDFERVPMIGQAFADEIFRVFNNKYPKITFVPINMSESVEFMVKRAMADR